MTRKTYCPMTIEHEALEMNQAVAGSCLYLKGTTGVQCEDCWPVGMKHTFTVFTNPNGLVIGRSNQNADDLINGWQSSNCNWQSATQLGGVIVNGVRRSIMRNDVLVNTDGQLDGYFDPMPDNQGVGVLHEIPAPVDAASGGGDFWYDQAGNIVYNSVS